MGQRISHRRSGLRPVEHDKAQFNRANCARHFTNGFDPLHRAARQKGECGITACGNHSRLSVREEGCHTRCAVKPAVDGCDRIAPVGKRCHRFCKLRDRLHGAVIDYNIETQLILG
jgi:hypothetical protein